MSTKKQAKPRTVALGTPGTPNETRLLLLGSGELGKEVALEAQRLGLTVIAADRYANAPAMQVAHRSHVLDMTDPAALRQMIERERPHFVVPEIEAIATDELLRLEQEGVCVIPTARAARLTMDREGVRRLAAEELKLNTSAYRFADSLEECRAAVAELGLPCVMKPVMSSSGKGQSVLREPGDVQAAFEHAQSGSRTAKGRVILERFIDFEYEITLLTVRHCEGTSFCPPVGHRQVEGDYIESWQPQPMSTLAEQRAEAMATKITGALGGYGIFGVEFFVKGDEVWFSEVSPRPHDTGMVTLVSQDLSEFALHVRAIIGLPIPDISFHGPSASHVIKANGTSTAPRFEIEKSALARAGTQLRLFGKPGLDGPRRLGVALARGDSTQTARKRARTLSQAVKVELD